MKKTFFFINDISTIINNSIKDFENIKVELKKGCNDIILKGLFTYQVSKLEIMMNEILREFLNCYPGKIPEKNFKSSKKIILNNPEKLIETITDTYIQNLSYDNINNYLGNFCDILSIDKTSDSINDKIVEMKETRNLLIHNDLKINEVYLSKCKGYCRVNDEKINKELPFDSKYVKECLDICIELTQFISDELKDKYKKYTKIKAMKQIWDYLFDSQILEFDDFWEHDDIYLKSFKGDTETFKGELGGGYSSTEMLLLFFLLMQYDHVLVEPYLKRYGYRFLNLNTLYGQKKEKYMYLQEVLIKYPSLFQDHSFHCTYNKNKKHI